MGIAVNEKMCGMWAKDAVARAKALLGAGWDHVSEEVRWGLVSAVILDTVVLGQDDSIRAEKVIANAEAVTAMARKLVAAGA